MTGVATLVYLLSSSNKGKQRLCVCALFVCGGAWAGMEGVRRKKKRGWQGSTGGNTLSLSLSLSLSFWLPIY